VVIESKNRLRERSNYDCSILKTQRKVVSNISTIRTSVCLCFFCNNLHRSGCFFIFGSMRTQGLPNLLQVKLVVLKVSSICNATRIIQKHAFLVTLMHLQ
jgi:hypothetical protein